MKEIPLTQGKVAIVDDEDYERLSQYRWFANKGRSHFYAARRISGRTILMHREILSAPHGFEVDHKNRNGLDNRRDNLRLATRSQNARNRPPPCSNTSGCKGVRLYKGAWRVRIGVQNREVYIGTYASFEHARDAYHDAARRLHGEFMHL